MTLPFAIAALALAVVGIAFAILAGSAAVRRRPLAFNLRALSALLFLALAALAALIGVGTVGYRALTQEEIVAWVRVEPAGPQRFTAKIRFPDDRSETFVLAGDQIHMDAHILKWTPIANLLGLHTAYELDRVAGRYRNLENEQSKQRTVFALGRIKPFDLFTLRERYAWLAPLVDAEYGSASFVPADRTQEWELRVSTSGLLFRPAASAPR